VNRATPYAHAMAEAARQYLGKCLQDSGGNVAGAARIAGLNRQHFYKLCARYQVVSPVPPPAPRPVASVFRAYTTR
jgi:DNA-binding NtrC family response regulator